MLGWFLFAQQAAEQITPPAARGDDAMMKAALYALIVAVTGLVTAATTWLGWRMRERKTKKDAENMPGQAYDLRRQADKSAEQTKTAVRELEGQMSNATREIKDLQTGVGSLTEKADDLGAAAGRLEDRLERVEEKTEKIPALVTDMEWVKKALERIERKLG